MGISNRAGQFFLFCALVVSMAVLFSWAGGQESQVPQERKKTSQPLIQSVKGADLYHAYCASCHGVDGKGNGPVAPALNTRPSDLTTIAQRNGGVFPTDRIRKVIEGEELISAHGSSEMPVWGPIFHRVEWDQDLGSVRLQNVTKYLETIQQK
jgi:mono/diheme cytochrome c family protein